MDAQAGLPLSSLQNLKTGFLASRPGLYSHHGVPEDDDVDVQQRSLYSPQHLPGAEKIMLK